MKIKVLKSFSLKLANQVDYIAKDKPLAARRFKKSILNLIKDLGAMPYKNRKSIHFDDKNIRELIIKLSIVLNRMRR